MKDADLRQSPFYSRVRHLAISSKPPTHIAAEPATDALLRCSPVVIIERLPHAHENYPCDFSGVTDALQETLRRDHLLHDLRRVKNVARYQDARMDVNI